MRLATPARADLKVSLYFPDDTVLCTCHGAGGQTATVSPPGDFTGKPFSPIDTFTARAFRSGVDVVAATPSPVIVVFGDSITDGYSSTVDTDHRWPDRLAERLTADRRSLRYGVVNSALSGNRVLADGQIVMFGQNALARFDRDVLSVPGVTTTVLLEGVNDIGQAKDSPPSVDAIITGYRQLIARAHAKGLRIVAGTLLPYAGAAYYRPSGDAIRMAVNGWILTSGAFDAVIDFDQAMRDPTHPERLRADLQSGDWLHPNDAGYPRNGRRCAITDTTLAVQFAVPSANGGAPGLTVPSRVAGGPPGTHMLQCSSRVMLHVAGNAAETQMLDFADIIRRSQRGQVGLANTAHAGRLQPLWSFGTNPGALNCWFYAPRETVGMGLVVVLHGCTQTAQAYDHGAGWSELAEQYGFAVLFPEQQRQNNPNLCFNWFVEEDTQRGGGEALSIRQMIAAVLDQHAISPDRIFVSGLSAGGAMAGVMLATYPELFAGGSIIAGLPYGAATSIPQAIARMRGAGLADQTTAAEKVRRASSHAGPWPTISVWHGDADQTVSVSNADAVAGQWRAVHQVEHVAEQVSVVDGQRHAVWIGSDGRAIVEEYRIAGMGHGTPLRTEGAESCGNAGPHMLEVGISSTWRQAESWDLLSGPAAHARPVQDAAGSDSVDQVSATKTPAGVQATIEQALRSAGLLQ